MTAMETHGEAIKESRVKDGALVDGHSGVRYGQSFDELLFIGVHCNTL